MKIILVNVNTSETMTEVIAERARKYASPGTQTVAVRPFFGADAVDCNFESYLPAVGVMDRVLAYDEPYDAVVLAGSGEHGRDGRARANQPPVPAHQGVWRHQPTPLAGQQTHAPFRNPTGRRPSRPAEA